MFQKQERADGSELRKEFFHILTEDVCSWTIVNEAAKLSDVMMKFGVPRSQRMQVRSSDYILSYFWKALKVFKQ